MILSFRYKIKEYSTAKNLLQILPFISIQTQRTFICPYNVLVCVDTGNLIKHANLTFLNEIAESGSLRPFQKSPTCPHPAERRGGCFTQCDKSPITTLELFCWHNGIVGVLGAHKVANLFCF